MKTLINSLIKVITIFQEFQIKILKGFNVAITLLYQQNVYLYYLMGSMIAETSLLYNTHGIIIIDFAH